MRKILLIIMILFSSLLFVACSEGNINNGDKTNEKEGDGNKEPSALLPDEKEKYEVYMLNAKLVSGDSDMYDFYILTKAGNKLTITITNTYEKDYLNSVIEE